MRKREKEKNSIVFFPRPQPPKKIIMKKRKKKQGARRRGHRQRRRHRLLRRLPRRPQRDLRGRKSLGQGQSPDQMLARLPARGHRARQARRPLPRPRGLHRAPRPRRRLLRRPHLLRPRHRRPLPLRPQHPPLRREQGRRHDESRADLHNRADDQRGGVEGRDVARRVDFRDERRGEVGAV